MLTIIIGVLLFSIVIYLAHIQYNIKNGLIGSAVVFSILLGLCLPVIGIFAPLQGYEEAVLQEDIDLISFKLDNEEKTTYVIESNGVYSYICEDNNELEKYYKVENLLHDTKVIESKDCQKPVLKVYKKKANKGIWTFALFADETKYVFYIPEGTIIRSRLIMK